MFSEISELMTQSLINNQIIQSDNRELYRYGIQQGLTMILNLATTLLIGVLCDMLWQSIVFHLAYIPLRSYAGGYHAKTPVRCYLFSSAMMFAILSVMRWVTISNLICGIMLLLSLVCVFLLAPVADHNKPLDDTEQNVYRHRARVIAVSEVLIVLACLWIHQEGVMRCITWSMATLSAILILGWIKNRILAN